MPGESVYLTSVAKAFLKKRTNNFLLVMNNYKNSIRI